MATYKVIQDVEAEDKLVGPLTLRQFIYALVAVGFGYLTFFLSAHGAGALAVPFAPVAIIAAFFAYPWGRDQPTELWALAKIRFFFKPRKRIWDQSGAKELVTVTAPKKLNINYTNGLSQTEVHSRLKVLADTLDSRGWAVRNADPNSPNQVVQAIGNQKSDRLVIATPAPVPQTIETDVKDADDIMDTQNNPIAKQFDTMITASAQAHRQQIIQSLQQTQPVSSGADNATTNTPQTTTTNDAGGTATSNSRWFLGQPMQPSVTSSQSAVTFNEQIVAPGTAPTSLPVTSATPTDEEEELIKKIEAEDSKPAVTYAHLHTIQPLSAQPTVQAATAQTTPTQAQPVAHSGDLEDAENARKAEEVRLAMQKVSQSFLTGKKQTQASVTQLQDAGILDLASNNDLNVATIAREAQKRRPQDEVVILLH